MQGRLTPESSLKAEKLDICMAAATEPPCSPPGDAYGMATGGSRGSGASSATMSFWCGILPPNRLCVCARRCGPQPPCPENNFDAKKNPTSIQSLVHLWRGEFWTHEVASLSGC